MLFPTSPRKILFACPLSPRSLPFLTVELALSSPCSRSDLILTMVRLSLTLTFSPLTIWCTELMALFLFLLEKTVLTCWQRWYLFLPETTRVIYWPGGVCYFCPLQSLVVSLRLPLISMLVLSWIGSALSHLNSSTHSRSSRCSLKNFFVLVTLAVGSFVFAATDIAFC